MMRSKETQTVVVAQRGERLWRCFAGAGAMALALTLASPGAACAEASEYSELEALFTDWRRFEQPTDYRGAPDYRAATLAKKRRELESYQARLAALEVSEWSVPQQVDYHLVRAEMNGLQFNLDVLKPWERDPAFYASVWTYQSDTPAHEGPTHHALVELWTYQFPLNASEQERLTRELRTVPPLLAQARENLVGNARELWVSGIGNLHDQAQALEGLSAQCASCETSTRAAIDEARQATVQFALWLELEAPNKTGPSGIGKENYTWYLRHVHLVPTSWEEEVTTLRRELDRAHASLRLEEHRNRELPPLAAIESAEEYEQRANESVTHYLAFLEAHEVLEVKDYMDPALRARKGRFVPASERNFFRTAMHYEPMTLYTHFYHWWDLARMEVEPHPSAIRRGPLLYNIFDSRAEGLATGIEEMLMHAGLYDEMPRVREIVWILLAQRAARGLGSLYVHANEFTMKEARDFHVDWTPRGWMREDLDLLGFEQQLYLRQPGYGTSYVTGKVLIERLLAIEARRRGDDFTLSEFFAKVDAVGVIPVSLIEWEMTDSRLSLDSAIGRPEEASVE